MSTTALTSGDGVTPAGRGLAVNFLLLSGGELLAKVLTFAAFIYLGRVLGPEKYGTLEFVLATMVFFTLPVDFGLGVCGARDLATDRGRAADLLRDVTTLRFVLACVCFILLILTSALLPGDSGVRAMLLVYGLSLFAEPLILNWFFQGHERMYWVALVNLVRRGGFALLVLFLVRPDTPLVWVGGFECAATAAAAAVCIWAAHRMGIALPRPRLWFRQLVDRLRKSAPIGLSELSWAGLWYLATLLTGLLARSEELGWFGATHRLVMALHTFVWLYFFNLLPSLTRHLVGPEERLQKLVGGSLALTTWFGTLVALGLTLISRGLLNLAYGPAYAGAAPTLAVLIWVIPVALISGHYRYLLIAAGLQRLEFSCTAVAAVAGLGLGILLIPPCGVPGAALALVASNVLNLGLAYHFAKERIARIPLPRKLVRPFLGSALALALFYSLADAYFWPATGAALLVYLVVSLRWNRQHVCSLLGARSWPALTAAVRSVRPE